MLPNFTSPSDSSSFKDLNKLSVSKCLTVVGLTGLDVFTN